MNWFVITCIGYKMLSFYILILLCILTLLMLIYNNVVNKANWYNKNIKNVDIINRIWYNIDT